jgi:Tol biopolymer transport system component
VRQASPHPDAAAISGDGRFIAFASLARLLPADGNAVHDVYVFDRRERTLTLESQTSDGSPSNGSSTHPRLNADGRYLVFESVATNLAPAGPPGTSAVFLRDRLTGSTKRVSVGDAGQDPNGRSEMPAISADGTTVAFVSFATDLVSGDDPNGGSPDIYVVRLATGRTTRITGNSIRREFAQSLTPTLSADGGVVVFAARLERKADAPAPALAVYASDTESGATTCISCSADDDRQGRAAFHPVVSGDGRTVAFTVVRDASSRLTDIAVHDRASAVTTIVTRRANAASQRPSLSGDGRFVAFETLASDLACARRCPTERDDNLASDLLCARRCPVERDDNLLPDVYLLDRETARFSRISGAAESWWAPSVEAAIDAVGATVVFSSRQPFGPEDGTTDFDLYVCSTSSSAH